MSSSSAAVAVRRRGRPWLCSLPAAAARRELTWRSSARPRRRRLLRPTASAASRCRPTVAFARCMRSHGVPTTPTRPQRRARQGEPAAARGQQLPVPGGPERLPAPAPERRQRAEPRPDGAGEGAGAEFSQCVRRHGVPNFPDPGSDGRIPDPATVGINQGSPKFEAANQACRRYRPPYMPSNAAYDAYARAHGAMSMPTGQDADFIDFTISHTIR